MTQRRGCFLQSMINKKKKKKLISKLFLKEIKLSDVTTGKNDNQQKEFINRPHIWFGDVWYLTPLSIIFLYIVVVSFIGGGNFSRPLTCRKSMTNFIT